MRNAITSTPEVGDDIILFVGFPIQLRQHLDGLTSHKEVIERYARHACHLSVVDEAHESVHEALRKIRILSSHFSVDGKVRIMKS